MELGIDLGTSTTVAYIRRDDGTTEPVLFDGTPLMPSAVYADPAADSAVGPAGRLLTGRDAIHSARAHPERFEPSPKRHIGGAAIEPMIGALLQRVAAEAARTAGAPAAAVTLTHPAAWGPDRRAVLQRAAAAAGLHNVRLVPEPVAAAAFHLRRPATGPSDLLVYDLGAGTFDVAIVRYAPPGHLSVLCCGGLDLGGLDLDASIVALLRARCGSPEQWSRLDSPVTVADRAAQRQLWDDVRTAKEMLSRTATTTLFVPLVEREQALTRAELEQLAQPLVQRTLHAVSMTIQACPVPLQPLGGVILVGGATRMPLVGSMLRGALNTPVTVIDQPELVVAAGSIDPVLTGAPAPVRPFAPAPPAGPGYAPPPPMTVTAPPPVVLMPPPPPAGPPAMITIVELITVSTPRLTGVTLRGQLHAGFGVVEHVFPTDDEGRLLLFADPNAMARHAAAVGPRDPLLGVPPARVRNDGSDDLCFDLDLLPEHLGAEPETWLPGYVCRCRDLAAQLAVFLDLDGTDDLIGPGSTIDRADDILRRHRGEPSARSARRKLARLDRSQLIEDWVDLIELIEAATVQPTVR
ncbi:Hsp70 family protein [Dactylosporangium matsuzakiense]|uniref:Hsp70 protein n=1 Tax=Dactylosporangium matsuzakiense TaxID=53360 RepID=A0A9W6KED8_9ACTN|nr:Hsp70 family protein [Dactylosporangium matsuzakiense]UWZ42540.1 Hsp70 family protein [Dactylosporangium matsuzakiense]GLL00541.1 hypothetical protein GCM10017581_022820 [Dactylosporangium matsuzakiense]